MVKPQAHRVLRAAGGDELIVVADFGATGRSAATFHDLVPLLRTDCTVWETAPVPYGQERGMTGAEQADRWLRDIRGSGRRVRALLGFCGGGVYAGVLAPRIATWQDPPRLLLFDPGFAERRMLTEHIGGFYRRLASTFTPPQRAGAERALRAADESAGDALELAGRLGELSREILLPAIRRAGYSAQASAEACDLITGYLHWLAGAVELDPRAAWASAVAVSSASPDVGLHAIPAGERAGLVAKASYVDVPHADLLRSPEVARTVDDLLG